MSNPMEQAQQVLAAIRNLVEQNQVKWTAMPMPQADGISAYTGTGPGPGFTIIAAKVPVEGRGDTFDGAATCGSLVIHLPVDLAKLCYNAAVAAQQ